MKTNFGDLFIFKIHCKIAALTLSITLQMYKQLHIQKLNSPVVYYTYNLQMPLMRLQLAVFQGKYPICQHVILTVINYIHLDRQLRQLSTEETQRECNKIMTIVVLTYEFRKLYLK
jgi:hypothetical protein